MRVASLGAAAAAAGWVACVQVPTQAQAAAVTEDLRARSKMPAHVATVLDSLPEDTHPMVQFSMGVLALQVRGGVPGGGGRRRGR